MTHRLHFALKVAFFMATPQCGRRMCISFKKLQSALQMRVFHQKFCQPRAFFPQNACTVWRGVLNLHPKKEKKVHHKD